MEFNRIRSLYYENKIEEAMNILNEMDKTTISLDKFNHIKMMVLNRKKLYNEALKIGEYIWNTILENHDQILVAIRYILALHSSYRVEQASDRLRIIDKPNLCDKSIFWINYVKSVIYTSEGNLKYALLFIEDTIDYLSFLDEIERKFISGIVYQRLGLINDYIGNLAVACKSYKTAVKYFEQIPDKYYLMKAYHNVANIYKLRGNIEEAYRYYIKTGSVAREINDISWIGQNYIDLGEYAVSKGDIKLALENYKQAEKILLESEDEYDLFYIFASYIELYCELKDRDNALKYYMILNEQPLFMQSAYIRLHIEFYEGLIFKLSNNTRSRANAMDIFERIAKDEVIDHTISFQALVNYLDMLIEDMISTRDEKIFNEIKSLIKRLEEFAFEQQVSNLIAKAFLFKSKIALIENEIDNSERYLKKALQLAEDYGYDLLAIQISAEFDYLNSITHEYLTDKISIQEKILKSRLNSIVHEQTITRPKVVKLDKTIPIGFFIYKINDKFILEYLFKEYNEVELLIQTMKTMIPKFTKDIHRIENYSMIFKNFNDYVFCYIFSGPGYESNKKLDDFINAYSDVFSNNKIDISTLQTIVKQIFI